MTDRPTFCPDGNVVPSPRVQRPERGTGRSLPYGMKAESKCSCHCPSLSTVVLCTWTAVSLVSVSVWLTVTTHQLRHLHKVPSETAASSHQLHHLHKVPGQTTASSHQLQHLHKVPDKTAASSLQFLTRREQNCTRFPF